jgi:hypothetical protein
MQGQAPDVGVSSPARRPLVNKPRSFQRIEALASSVPTHPDVEPARKCLGLSALRSVIGAAFIHTGNSNLFQSPPFSYYSRCPKYYTAVATSSWDL